jgi:hypothetical protein
VSVAEQIPTEKPAMRVEVRDLRRRLTADRYAG